MKKILTLITIVLASVNINAENSESTVAHIIHIQQPENSKGSITCLTGTNLNGNMKASTVSEIVNHGNAYSVVAGYGCPLIAQYDKNMYKAEFKCSDPQAGKIIRYTGIDGTEADVFMVTPTKDCTVSLQLTYCPQKVSFGSKKVTYSENTVDADGDGKIVVNGTELSFRGANIDGSLQSPYSDTYMIAKEKNTISGDIVTNGQLHVYSESESASRNTALNLSGGIHCKGTSKEDMDLVISGTEVYAYSQSNMPVISGFTSFDIDEEKYMMIEPLGGRYDKEKRILVDGHGKPATTFIVVNRDRYEIDDHDYNYNNEDYLTGMDDTSSPNTLLPHDTQYNR